ncbi:MAG: FtsW/RodA/SpoVE family cell cycle protein, partial [Flavobacteriales bacterium]|nr:FtsW/RodA/SpoVE family cell cycle protein [Flavobacteriales bacterium]
MNQLIQKLQGDRVIWMVALFLSIVSLLAVYSSISTLAVKHEGSTASILIKHGCMLAVGMGLMYYVHRMHYKYFSRMSMILIWVAVLLLIYTLLFGSNLNNADRWIRLPIIGLTFQTSDFAKIVLVLYVARQLSLSGDKLHDFKGAVLPVLIPVGAV